MTCSKYGSHRATISRLWLSQMIYRYILVVHIIFALFLLFVVHSLSLNIVFLISFMELLINKWYLVSLS